MQVRDRHSLQRGQVGNWHTVYNFVDLADYTFVENVAADAPFVFLGRLDRIKGCHHCIALAKKLNHKLIIAGNISHLQHEKDYFDIETSKLCMIDFLKLNNHTTQQIAFETKCKIIVR